MKDVIVIGTGPAALMCCLELDKNLDVLILEKNYNIGKKLLLTGGGRCNITNNISNSEFLDNISHNKKYLYSTINKFGPSEVINLLSDVGLKEEEDNKMFPISDRSNDIVNFFRRNISFPINFNEEVLSVKTGDSYVEVTTTKDVYKCKNVVFAVGGTSFKNTGSTGDVLKFAKDLDVNVVPFYPAESSIILNRVDDLAGTSFENVEVKASKHVSSGNMIFTHKGLSGNAIMNISEYIHLEKIKRIYVDFLPFISEALLIDELKLKRDYKIVSYLSEFFSKKFIYYLLEKVNVDKDSLIKQIDHKKFDLLISYLKNYEFLVNRVSPIDLAYVCGGGISLKEMDTSKFCLKKNSNIYFIGECIDVHGPIGGYNITLAMSMGYSCSVDINKKLSC